MCVRLCLQVCAIQDILDHPLNVSALLPTILSLLQCKNDTDAQRSNKHLKPIISEQKTQNDSNIFPEDPPPTVGGQVDYVHLKLCARDNSGDAEPAKKVKRVHFGDEELLKNDDDRRDKIIDGDCDGDQYVSDINGEHITGSKIESLVNCKSLNIVLPENCDRDEMYENIHMSVKAKANENTDTIEKKDKIHSLIATFEGRCYNPTVTVTTTVLQPDTTVSSRSSIGAPEGAADDTLDANMVIVGPCQDIETSRYLTSNDANFNIGNKIHVSETDIESSGTGSVAIRCSSETAANNDLWDRSTVSSADDELTDGRNVSATLHTNEWRIGRCRSSLVRHSSADEPCVTNLDVLKRRTTGGSLDLNMPDLVSSAAVLTNNCQIKQLTNEEYQDTPFNLHSLAYDMSSTIGQGELVKCSEDHIDPFSTTITEHSVKSEPIKQSCCEPGIPTVTVRDDGLLSNILLLIFVGTASLLYLFPLGSE